MKKLFFLVTILLYSTIYCQSDSLDTIFLNNGDVIKGKVIKVKQYDVDFLEQSTSIMYEYEKIKINFITLANGKTLWFNKESPNAPNTQEGITKSQRIAGGTQYVLGLGFLYALKSDHYESGMGVDLFLKSKFPNILTLMLNFGYYSADTKVSMLSKGNASFFLPEINLLLEAKKGSVQPYAGLGVGYYIVDNTLDDELVNYFRSNGYNIKEEVESGIGFNIRGGFNISLSDNIGLIFDLKYWFYNPKAKSTVTQIYPYGEYTAENEIQLNNLSFIIGFGINL